MSRLRVLVADDHAGVRRSIARALAPLDVELVFAESCAISRAHIGEVDLAIVDYHLGDGSGDELAKELLTSTRLKAVVFFTATDDVREIERMRLLGRVVGKLDDGVGALRVVLAELVARPR